MTARSTSNQSQQVDTFMHFKKLKGVSLIDSEGVCESLVSQKLLSSTYNGSYLFCTNYFHKKALIYINN